MVDTQYERENKFDVQADFRLPAAERLAAVAGASVAAETETVQLVSTYYDTAEHALVAQRVTLRRREGDADTGWHLKVPAAAARTEIRLPIEAGDDVPEELARLVAGLSLGTALQPVATIATTRRITRLIDGGATVAEIADDSVRGDSLGEAAHHSEWREIEIELGSGDEALLRKLSKALVAAGARASKSRSKLARALGTEYPVERARDEATQLMAAYLQEQFGALSAGDIGLRRGQDPIHDTRVAIRRIRSTFRVFEPSLNADAQLLEPDLSWYQDLLGDVRDHDVQRARLARKIADLPPELVLGPVAADVENALLAEQLHARARLAEGLDSERYRSLMLRLRACAADPPMRTHVDVYNLLRDADDARRKARKRLKRGANKRNLELLHRARKAGKRARYAAELTQVAAGKSAVKRIAHLKDLQDALGELQDSVLSADHLRRLGSTLGAKARRNGFTFGLLYERELALQAQLVNAASRLRA